MKQVTLKLIVEFDPKFNSSEEIKEELKDIHESYSMWSNIVLIEEIVRE